MFYSLKQRAETIQLKNISFFHIIITLMICWFIFNYFHGERVLAGDGIGWDGVLYAKIAQSFGTHIHDRLLNYYHIQRIFPSLIVSVLAKIFGVSLETPKNIIHYFYVYNIIVTLIGIYIFYCISRFQEWKLPVFIIGFSGVFLNFATLKHIEYYPVLTDYTALVLALLQIYFYLHRSFIGLSIVTLIGAFTFPTLLFSGVLLLLFQKTKKNKVKRFGLIKIKVSNSLNGLWVSVGMAGLIALLTAYFLKHPVATDPLFLRHPLTSLLGIISVASVFIYMISMIKPFIRTNYFAKINLNVLFFAMCFCLTIHIIQQYLSNGSVFMPVTTFIGSTITRSAIDPFVFLVAHFVYFGPVVILIIFYWKEMVVITYEQYPGLMMLLFIFGLILINPESRTLVNALPLFVFTLCEALNRMRITMNFAYWIMGLSLFVSKLWLPINIWPWKNELALFTKFPQQMYFMNHGIYMGDAMYFVQLIIMILTCSGLWLWKRSNKAIKPNIIVFIQQKFHTHLA